MKNIVDLNKAVDRYVPQIEAELRDVLAVPGPGLAGFYGMMHYHLGWVDQALSPVNARAGKRLRPVLCLLVCQALGGDAQKALPAAAAIELVHNFSLLHDDIEDQSATRRHRATAWKIWGEAHAINAGDGMFVLARLALGRLAERGVPATLQVAVTRLFDETCLTLCHGQYLDISFEERLDVSVDEYLTMIGGKSAALIACAARVGATLATDDAALVQHYERFGWHMGLAFQIQDDVLGMWGAEAETGKPVGGDIRQRKKSLPVVYALEHEGEGGELRRIYAQDALDDRQVASALRLLDESGAHQYAQEMAAQHQELALAELSATGIENEAQGALREVAGFVVRRSY